MNLKAAEKTREEPYRQRAAQFLNTVLGMRDETTGAIWGARPPADWTAYARTFQHPYTAYQAELAANLFEFSRLDAAAEKAGRAQPKAQRLHVGKIAPHAAAPARVPLEIEATSGLAPRIDVVSGPATVEGDHVLLSGEAGIVVLRITQDGDTLFLPATPVEIPFAVGDVRPAPAQGLTGQALDMETFRLSWETGAMDLAGFRVESAPADGGAWTTLATVGPQSTRHEFPAGGAGPWFRVIAFNPVMDAEPSAAIRVEPLAREIRITLAPAEASAGKDWELRDFDDAPGGRAWVPLSHTIRDGPTEEQTISYEVGLDGPPGRYHVHYLCWGNSGSNDSAWFRLEGQPWHAISITNAGQWQWRSATFEIRESGKHRISFGARQSTTARGTPAPRIATVLVTNGPRPD